MAAVFAPNLIYAEAIGCLLGHSGGFEVASVQTHLSTLDTIVNSSNVSAVIMTDEFADADSTALISRVRQERKCKVVLVNVSGKPVTDEFPYDVQVNGWAGAGALLGALRQLGIVSEREAAQVVGGQSPGLQQVKLSAREREVADLVAQGLTNSEISAQLGINLDSVKNHIRALFRKFGCKNRTSLLLCVKQF